MERSRIIDLSDGIDKRRVKEVKMGFTFKQLSEEKERMYKLLNKRYSEIEKQVKR